MDTVYSKELMRHFRYPQNIGRMKDFDGVGKVGNLLCGDVLWLYIKIDKDKKGKEIIKKASFLTLGCAVAIANSSLLTVMIKGKTLEEAMNITKEDLLKKLGKVPVFKIHCSLLAVDALSEAIYDYLRKKKREIPKEIQERHNRLKKENKEINKRYKEWVKIEEKIHKNAEGKR